MLKKHYEQLQGQKAIVKDLWAKACKYDGIPIDSMFCVFSEFNPHVEELNTETAKLQSYRSALMSLAKPV